MSYAHATYVGMMLGILGLIAFAYIAFAEPRK